jgi:hypothetical protein
MGTFFKCHTHLVQVFLNKGGNGISTIMVIIQAQMYRGKNKQRKNKNLQNIQELLLFNVKCAIFKVFQPYHNENMLHFDEMMLMSALINTLICIFIVLAD